MPFSMLHPSRKDMITMTTYGKTDVGRVRESNQDCFRIETIGAFTLCVVCDGMGGAAGGSTASGTACEVFVREAAKGLEAAGSCCETYESVLRAALDAANRAVYSLANGDESLAGMGTTLCAVLTDEKRFWGISVGDSRLYLFADGNILQLSHDHSYVQALLDNGAITPEESKNHPNKNIITRAVGTAEAVECDSFVMDFTMDGLLICSDGLTNFVSDSELNALFMQYTNPERLAEKLIESANAAGGADNITAVLIRKQSPDGKEG